MWARTQLSTPPPGSSRLAVAHCFRRPVPAALPVCDRHATGSGFAVDGHDDPVFSTHDEEDTWAAVPLHVVVAVTCRDMREDTAQAGREGAVEQQPLNELLGTSARNANNALSVTLQRGSLHRMVSAYPGGGSAVPAPSMSATISRSDGVMNGRRYSSGHFGSSLMSMEGAGACRDLLGR